MYQFCSWQVLAPRRTRRFEYCILGWANQQRKEVPIVRYFLSKICSPVQEAVTSSFLCFPLCGNPSSKSSFLGRSRLRYNHVLFLIVLRRRSACPRPPSTTRPQTHINPTRVPPISPALYERPTPKPNSRLNSSSFPPCRPMGGLPFWRFHIGLLISFSPAFSSNDSEYWCLNSHGLFYTLSL